MLSSDFFLMAMYVLVGFVFYGIGRIAGYQRGADAMRRQQRKTLAPNQASSKRI